MANDDRRNKRTGRVTPKKGSPPSPNRPTRARRSIAPARIGPFARPDRHAPIGQVGRQPRPPAFLLVAAGVYLVCGVAAFYLLSGSLAIILGVVFLGMGLLWVRGAATAYLRQNRRGPGD